MSQQAAPPRKRATRADLEDLPDTVVGEILDGELIVSPRPRVRHAFSTVGLTIAIVPPFQQGTGGPGGWWFLAEPEIQLHDDTLVPDLAGWRRSRLPAIPDVLYLELAPDWVCEVLSPSTERHYRGRKLRIYAREGVGHVWFLNPSTQTLEIFRLAGRTWQLVDVHSGDASVIAEPFEAISLPLSSLWAPSEPAPPGS